MKDKVFARLRRLDWVLPWLSLAWGLASGVRISRAYDEARSLIAYALAFVVMSWALSVWFKVQDRERRRKVPAFVVDNLTQTAIQYVVMFTLPFLWLSGSYRTLFLACVCVATTLWDPWWTRLQASHLYITVLRMLVSGLLVSFCLPVFWPEGMPFFYPLMCGALALAAFPFGGMVGLLPRRDVAQNLLAVGLCLALLARGYVTGRWVEWPLIAVWVKGTALGAGIKGRNLSVMWQDEVSAGEFAAVLAHGEAVCCATPLIGPSGLHQTLAHEWYQDDELVERISLREVDMAKANESEASPYRTYSCKRHFFLAKDTPHEIRCRTLIAGHVALGSVAVAIY